MLSLVKMSWIQSQITVKGGLFTHPHYFLSSPPSSSSSSSSPNSSPNHIDYQKHSSSGNKISPAILFIIVILAVIFFISGLLHLLVRFLSKHRSSVSESNNTYPEMSGSDAFQRQLQQLFHLHDSGLDQAFIDALPVFLYKDIMGLKEPFDCAVCLCEFYDKDKLRLLPACSHAFHIDCIDTWLLSNSTCPLCRASLYYTPGLPFENPVFDFEFESRELEDEFTSNSGSGGLKQPADQNDQRINSRRVFSVRLGKFKSSNIGAVERGEGETSSSNLDARRCFSMGSYQYVVADSEFKVSFCPTISGATGTATTTSSIKLVKGRNGQNGNLICEGDVEGKKINIRSRGESFSVSKIWQWSKKDKFQTSSQTQLDSSSSPSPSVAVGLPSTLNDPTHCTL